MDFRAENKGQTDRLRSLLGRLDPSLWRKDIGGGWTIGTMIVHLAFWEKMTQIRIEKWTSSGVLTAVPDGDNVFAINDSIREISAGIEFQAGAKMAVEAFESMDQLVSKLDASRLAELERTGRDRWFKRFLHRDAHLTRIEKSVG
ncbi:MAG: hypothetical protein JNM27_20705 [Leptospirales bacterium]|nr:hypothetical protein [Leptospirales bacterium]